jgi:hypothetical protein
MHMNAHVSVFASVSMHVHVHMCVGTLPHTNIHQSGTSMSIHAYSDTQLFLGLVRDMARDGFNTYIHTHTYTKGGFNTYIHTYTHTHVQKVA